jgi:hypothetical protein
MLQGIANISTNTEHGEIKKDYKLYGKHRSYMSSEESNDLIQVSPAFKFLAKLNWKIETIDTSDKEKINLSFSILDYVFKITIDLRLLSHLNKVYFEVKRKNGKRAITLIISTSSSISEHENMENILLESFDVLFTRLEYFVITNEFQVNGKRVSYGYYEDLVPGLKKEFQKILFALLVFVEKLTSQKVLERFKQTNPNSIFETLRLENVEVC